MNSSVDFVMKILMTMVNNNKNDNTVFEIFKKYFGNNVLNTKIRYRAKPANESSMNNNYLIDSKLNLGYELKKLVDEVEEYFK